MLTGLKVMENKKNAGKYKINLVSLSFIHSFCYYSRDYFFWFMNIFNEKIYAGGRKPESAKFIYYSLASHLIFHAFLVWHRLLQAKNVFKRQRMKFVEGKAIKNK